MIKKHCAPEILLCLLIILLLLLLLLLIRPDQFEDGSSCYIASSNIIFLFVSTVNKKNINIFKLRNWLYKFKKNWLLIKQNIFA